MTKLLRAGVACAFAVLASACTVSKSENPLSPTIAGPLPGVNITAPNPIQPRDGLRILNDQQPVTLTLDNASSTSVRPFWYQIDVATDAGFVNKVVSQDNVTPAATGRTTFRLPSPLTSGKSYWWRARARDGANDGPYSPNANFEIIVPAVFQAPVLVAPISDATVTGLRPTFSWNNAARSGTAIGTVVYDVEVSEDPTFAVKAGASVNENAAGVTSGTSSEDGRSSKHYYWHARAKDQIVTGPWSITQSFFTPAASGGTTPTGPANSACHIGAGALTIERATLAVYGCGDEFPSLLAVFGSESQAVAAADELLRRTIWHLQLAGFQAARQRNPSGLISSDKMSLFINGAWHVYDLYSLGGAGVATRITGMNEVPLPNPIADPGLPD